MFRKPDLQSERSRALMSFVGGTALPLLVLGATGLLPGSLSTIHLQLLLFASVLFSAQLLGLTAGLVNATLGFGLMLWRAIANDGVLGFQATLDAFLWFAVAKLAVALVVLRRNQIARLSQARDQAQAEARRRELLLAELSHRVGNDLSLLVSMLHMHAAAEPDAASALHAAAGRVHVLGRVHERLSRRVDAEALVDSCSFLESLVADLRAGLDGTWPIALTVNAENHSLPLAVASDVGLVVNELMTNALKHAFPEGREGVVRVTFRRDGDAYELLVADNGAGIAPPRIASSVRVGGFGGQLLRALALQLGGRLEISAGEVGGTSCVLRFPVPPAVSSQPSTNAVRPPPAHGHVAATVRLRNRPDASAQG